MMTGQKNDNFRTEVLQPNTRFTLPRLSKAVRLRDRLNKPVTASRDDGILLKLREIRL